MDRLRTFAFWQRNGWKLACAALLAGVAFAPALVLFVGRQATIDQRVCGRLDVLNGALVGILERSAKGLPANPYYRRHPDQLRTALVNLRFDVADIRAAGC